MREQFQVNLRGIVDILSHHLYSSPRVYLRELIQNGRDAITARQLLEPGIDGRIDLVTEPGSDTLIVRDNGIGLTPDEMRDLLATIGASSKRSDFTTARKDFLGQFGIGLLSCFLVADQIEVRSRSARSADAPTNRWIGYADGTFSVTEADVPLPYAGTEVVVRPRRGESDWVSPGRVRALAETFARYLDVPVVLGEQTISRQRPPWEMPAEEAALYCHAHLGFTPLDVIDLDFDVLGFRGVGFITGDRGRVGDRPGDEIYCRGMLISQHNDQLAPDWAYFVRIVADAGDLAPTASRESLQENDLLADIKSAIGTRIHRHIDQMLDRTPDRFDRFAEAHAVGLRSLAVSDPQMLAMVCRHIPVESTVGRRPLDELLERFGAVRFVDRVDEYRVLADLVRDQGQVLINAGYVYEPEIMQQVIQRRPGSQIARLDLGQVVDALPGPADQTDPLVQRVKLLWAQVMGHTDLQLALRDFAPDSTPALWVPGKQPPGTDFFDDDEPDDAFGGLVGDLLGDLVSRPETVPPRLVLNLRSAPVRALGADLHPQVAEESIRALLSLGLLMAGERLTERESAMLSRSLRVLIIAAAGGISALQQQLATEPAPTPEDYQPDRDRPDDQDGAGTW